MSKFDQAFSKARKSGAKEFDFGGKKFNTKLKGEGASKKKSSLPKSAPVPTSRSSAVSGMAKKAPSYSSLSQVGKESKISKSGPSAVTPTKRGNATYKSEFMTDKPALNDFKQKETRRSSDNATGKASAPGVKKAIGKFMLGKGYKG